MRDRRDGAKLSGHLLRLTHALYRVTRLLPRDEPLRRGIREKAGDIFSRGIAMTHGRASSGSAGEAWVDIEIMLGYLAVARVLGCADPINFLALEREYRLLADAFAVRGGDDARGLSAKEEGTLRVPGDNTRDPVPVPAQNEKSVPHKTDLTPAAREEINERQKRIMDRLARTGQAKISDFFEHFGDISSKTIQRDLQDLTTRNLIRKAGDKRWTIYTLV